MAAVYRKPKDVPEIWRDIRGYTTGRWGWRYQVSNLGRVRKAPPEDYTGKQQPHMMKPVCKRGQRGSCYYVVKLCKGNGEYDIRKIAWLVWETFAGCVPRGCSVVHRNGLKEDNTLDNLRIMTRQELGKNYARLAAGKGGIYKVDREGNVLEWYPSSHAATKECHMSYQTILDRCNRKLTRDEYDPHGYTFRWADEYEGEMA